MRARWTVVGIALIGVIVAGCASAASRVRSEPVRGQAEAQRERDVAQCSAFAAEAARGDREQDGPFAACMVARGYRVGLPVRVGLEHGEVNVEARGEPAVAQVANDFRECASRIEASGRRPSSTDVVASHIGFVSRTNDPDWVHTIRSEALEREFSACFADRGYVSAPSSGGSR
jgi:hypothetical protein